MKFGDKLIILRKKNGLSQEELADKLGVSRQSVSKWESNNTYPETDKIVQICNLFDCSMDDLINDKVTDVEGSLRKNKNNINEVWDSLLEFITKSINMFSHMKFTTGLKCVIEMFIIAFLLWLVGLAVCGISSNIIANLFSFFGTRTTSIIENVLSGIFNILWFVIAVITLVHTFKIRYLNYYEDSDNNIGNTDSKNKYENNNDKDDKNNNKNMNAEREEKNIQNEKNRPFAFLSILSKIVLFFLKFIVFWIAFCSIFVLIGLVIGFVISLAFIPTNIIFVGSTLALGSGVSIAVLFLLLCIYFIISRKVNVKVFIITFISSLIIFGVGIGICGLSIKNFDIIEKNESKNLTVEKITIPVQDDLTILSSDLYEYNYVIDDTLADDSIEIEALYNHDIKQIDTKLVEENKMNIYKIHGDFNTDYKENYKLFIEDLKNNKIDLDHLDSSINGLTIRANSKNINKLISNLEKVYLLEKVNNGNTIKVIRHRYKVEIINGRFVEYDARKDELIYKENAPKDYKCSRTVRKDTWGEFIQYDCTSPDEYYDYEVYNDEFEEDYD